MTSHPGVLPRELAGFDAIRPLVDLHSPRTAVCGGSENLGSSNWKIIRRHLLPNMFGLIFVQAALITVGIIYIEVTLSIFGVASRAPAPILGRCCGMDPLSSQTACRPASTPRLLSPPRAVGSHAGVHLHRRWCSRRIRSQGQSMRQVGAPMHVVPHSTAARGENTDMADAILEVRNLSTRFFTRAGVVKAVEDVSYSIGQGETLGIVGESGRAKVCRRCRSCG